MGAAKKVDSSRRHSALPIHARLRAYREERGLSIQDTAKLCGVTARQWESFERPGANPPSEPLLKACEVFGVMPNDMFS